jgi:hypothetical protein
VSSDTPPDSALITPVRLAEIVREIDEQDVVDRAALLAAMRAAAWPSRFAFEN